MPVIGPIPHAAVEPVLIRSVMYDDRVVRQRLHHDAVVSIGAFVPVAMIHVLVTGLRSDSELSAARYRHRGTDEQHGHR